MNEHSEGGTWGLHEPCCESMQALGELSGKALGCLLVVGTDGKLLGTFTDGDLRRTLQSRGAQVPCSVVPCTLHSIRPPTFSIETCSAKSLGRLAHAGGSMLHAPVVAEALVQAPLKKETQVSADCCKSAMQTCTMCAGRGDKDQSSDALTT